MNILALDLGTLTGFCYNQANSIYQGTWKLGTAKEITAWGKDRSRRRKDPRIGRLCELLSSIGHFDVVVFEDVEFASSVYQMQLWSSLRATVWLCAKGSLVDCIAVGTLKKFATGSGNAVKESMSRALEKKYPSLWASELDDNAVDATWIYLWAKTTFGRMVNKQKEI